MDTGVEEWNLAMAHTSVCAGVAGRERRNNLSPDSGAGSRHKRETWAM